MGPPGISHPSPTPAKLRKLVAVYCWHHGVKRERDQDTRPPSKTALRTDRVRAFPPGDSRVYVWSAVSTPDRCPQPHTGPHLLPKQPQAARQSEGLRPALQHGPGECEGDVD